MKTAVSENSLRAYWEMRDAGELPEKERIVYHALARHGRMTREQISDATGMRLGSVCGRVNTLVKRGLVVGVANLVNPVTKSLNEVVDLALHRKAIWLQQRKQAAMFSELEAA